MEVIQREDYHLVSDAHVRTPREPRKGITVPHQNEFEESSSGDDMKEA